MGTKKVLHSVYLTLTVVGVLGSMDVNDENRKKAESLYDSKPVRGPRGNPKHRPVSELITCLEGVFGVPFPASPPATTTTTTMKTTTTNTKTTTTTPVTERCIYTDGNSKPENVSQRHRLRRSTQLEHEISTFHQCICRSNLNDYSRPCYFNMMETGYMETVLNASLGDHKANGRARLTYRKKEFHCRLNEDFLIVCRIKRHNVQDNDTKFQDVVFCLSNALEPHVCDAIPATPPNYPVSTTGRSLSTSKGDQSIPVGIIILILGCAVCLLLGILCTACCIVCWRNRRKRHENRTMVKRSSRQAQLNSYSGNVTDNHIYDELPDTAVPDLLQQSPVHSRFGSERSVAVNMTQRSVSYSPSVQSSGYYEPLSRRDDQCPMPVKPIPKRRWQPSVPNDTPVGPHDYLDLVEESNQEDQEYTTEENGYSGDNPYFVLEPKETNSLLSNKASNHDVYVELQEGCPVSLESEDESSCDKNSQASNHGTCSSVSEGVTTHDYFILEVRGDTHVDDSSTKPEITQSENCPDDNDSVEEFEIIETSKCLDNDQYEIPVAEVTSFDLASSFKVKEEKEDRRRRRYKDYQTILPVVGESSDGIISTPEHFVLES